MVNEYSGCKNRDKFSLHKRIRDMHTVQLILLESEQGGNNLTYVTEKRITSSINTRKIFRLFFALQD